MRETRGTLSRIESRIATWTDPEIVEQQWQRAVTPWKLSEQGDAGEALSWYDGIASVIDYRFGRGDDVAELVASFETMLQAFEDSHALARRAWVPETLGATFEELTDLATPRYYARVVHLASWAAALAVSREQFDRIAAVIGPEERARDRLIDGLLAAGGGERGGAIDDLFPDAFGLLGPIFDTAGDDAAKAVAAYLRKWKGAVTKFWQPWGGLPKPTGGAYRGYWAWEAAAVVVALGLDDSAARKSEYYPADLADFGLARS